jgi:ABC-type multidrug transport system ATPase subunit
MSEPILIALVQLFAIVSATRHHRQIKNTRLIIEAYLNQYLNGKELEEYLLLYDELFLFHIGIEEKTDLDSAVALEKILKICTKIGKSLQQKDKIIIFIKFIEFIAEISKDTQTTYRDKNQDLNYYQAVSSSFNLSESEYNTIISFILNPLTNNENENILAISSSPLENAFTSNTIFRDRLQGHILILYIKSVGLFIGRYHGDDDLYLNGHYINRNHSFILNPGGIIKSQKIDPIYYTDVAAKMRFDQEQVKLQFVAENIGFSFKNSSNGIQPFSFSAESGELIGVMGGSGAGKSTLLSLLNGSLSLKNGNIFINGHDLETKKDELKRIIGYIPQDDLLIEELTVFQNLYFNARLCFDNYSHFKLKRIILKILNDIDLIGIRDLVVGSPLNKVISGGQRKRLNIALELLREPFVLFADEPTSGLSSMDSEMVMMLLKEQTLKGRLVMVNIHQPSSTVFKLFDKLLMLDKGGFPIFYGNPIDSIIYFKSEGKHVNPTESECLSCGYVNPEQIFQITEAKTINKHGEVTNQRISSPADWYKIFLKKLQPLLKTDVKNDPLPNNNFKIPNPLNQFKIFSLRNLYIKLTNKQYILLNLLEAPFLAIILAYLTRYSSAETYIFGQNKNLIAYLFMSIVVALFLGMMVSAEEIVKDRKILKREAFLTLSRFSYLNAKIAFLFALSAIQTLLYVVLGNLILGINGMAFGYWAILFTTSCFANMVGLNLSSGLNSVVNIYILIPFFLVPQLLLSGVIVPFNTLNRSISAGHNVPVVGDLMASRWAFEALTVNQYVNNQYSKHFYFYDKQLSNYAYNTGYLIPALQAKVDECHRNFHLNINHEETELFLELIQIEIAKLETECKFESDELDALLSIDKLNEKARITTQAHLDSLSGYYTNLRNNISSTRDQVYTDLTNKMGKQAVFEMKQKAHNTSLEDWVLNKRDNQNIAVSTKGFIRKKDPVFMNPDSRIGRAHFYAPVKYLGSIKITTPLFNVAVIWLMTLVLYVTLLHDTLKKVLNYFAVLQKRKISSASKSLPKSKGKD